MKYLPTDTIYLSYGVIRLDIDKAIQMRASR